MSDRLLAGIGFLVLASSSAQGQTVDINHQPLGCAVAQRFPRLDARLTPADTVAKARVLFQGENTKVWYAVEMKPDGLAFFGVLPQPKKSLKAFRYYIEVTDKALRTSRTTEYTTNVVGGPGACRGKTLAATLGSASVLLHGPAGVAALPAGFASTGVVTAGSAAASAAGAGAGGGGGLSGGAVAGIVGGVGAAAAGVAVVASKSAGETSKSAGEPSSSTSYSGPLSGQLSLTLTATGGGGGIVICGAVIALGGTMRVTLEQSSATPAGQAETSMTETQTGRFGDPGCGTAPAPRSLIDPIKCAVSGTPGSLACSVQRAEGGGTLTFSFSGALSGNVISGTLTYGRTDNNGSTTGSTTFPVTLR